MHFKDPAEFLISGEETLLEISTETTSEQGTQLWGCRFHEFKELRRVRRAIIEYYWPVESCLFLAILEKRRNKMLFSINEFLGRC
jgi:hypothetical protein